MNVHPGLTNVLISHNTVSNDKMLYDIFLNASDFISSGFPEKPRSYRRTVAMVLAFKVKFKA